MKSLSDATAGLFTPLKFADTDLLIIGTSDDSKYFNIIITDIGHTGNPSFNAAEEWLQRCPEKKRLAGSKASWQLAASDWTANIIETLWPANQIRFMDAKAKTLYKYLLLTTKQQEQNAAHTALYKVGKIVPDHGLTLNAERPLTPFQQVAAHCTTTSDGYALYMEQGCGKTPVVIAKICNEAAKMPDGQLYKAIIVCPKNVRHNWVSEIEKFGTCKGRVTIIKGGEIERITQLIEAVTPRPVQDGVEPDKFTVLIISYESMTRSMDALSAIQWDLSVLDEAHYIKRITTKRAAASMLLRDTSKCRLVLTGTPVSNSPLDLYSMFEFMGQGWSGFSSYQAFKDFYGVFVLTGNDHHKKLVDCQNLPFMRERLARMSFIITKKEALPDLPAKVYDSLECEMTERQMDVYRSVAENLIYECESLLGDGENSSIVANNVLTRLLRLAQIASGYAVYDSGETEYFDDCDKLTQLVELLKEKGPDDKTLVWSSFVPCIKQISQRLTNEGMKHVTFFGGTTDEKRQEAERLFNTDPGTRIFIGNPAAGGTGLNLLGFDPNNPDKYTTNANHALYYACSWSMVQRSQSEDRCYRMGTRTQVRISDLFVPDTVDEEIRIRVMRKRMMALDMLDVREILGNVLMSLKTLNGKAYA